MDIRGRPSGPALPAYGEESGVAAPKSETEGTFRLLPMPQHRQVFIGPATQPPMSYE